MKNIYRTNNLLIKLEDRFQFAEESPVLLISMVMDSRVKDRSDIYTLESFSWRVSYALPERNEYLRNVPERHTHDFSPWDGLPGFR